MAHRQHRPNISTTNRKTIDIEAMPIPIRFALGERIANGPKTYRTDEVSL